MPKVIILDPYNQFVHHHSSRCEILLLTQLLVRRCIAYNTIPLRPRLLLPIPRSAMDESFRSTLILRSLLELLPQIILHLFFPLYRVRDVEDLCADEGKRKGMEIRECLFRRFFDRRTIHHDDFQDVMEFL